MSREATVIGSGPAGVSAAAALVERGVEVTLIDGGAQLEPSIAGKVDQLAAMSPDAWPRGLVEDVHGQVDSTSSGVPLKLLFGSDFPYREADRLMPTTAKDVELRATLARGGFSTVWGAAVMPYAQQDINDWPIKLADLEPHYRAVAGFMPIAGIQDDLAQRFPLYTDHAQPLTPSRQAKRLMDRLEPHRAALIRQGVFMGRSRVAVQGGDDGCVHCGSCLYGCPYRYIYNSSSTLQRLVATGKVKVITNVMVERLEEIDGQVRLTGRKLDGSAAFEATAPRVYLATGVLPTARLLLASQSQWDRPVVLRDSQYFLIPLLERRAMRSVQGERLHALSQMFIELSDPAVSPNSVHLQLYTFNDLFTKGLQNMAGPLAKPAGPMIRATVERMLLIQGYLHSKESGSIRMTLSRDGEGSRLLLEGDTNAAKVKAAVGRVARKVAQLRRFTGLHPVKPMIQIAKPGRGYHCGGTFPMRDQPGELECDTLGRPSGWQRLHIVDASTFPSVPATTITFSVMANAHRIASAHDQT